MAEGEPAPAVEPNPKLEPAPPAADQAGDLKQLRAELEALRKVVSEMPEEFAKLIPKVGLLPPPTRRPLPGFKPGVFKGR